MGDSEDEYDRKRRDKFRGERTESYPRGDSRRATGDDRRREDWIERDFQRNRGTNPRGEYREYRGGGGGGGGGGGRERYSPSRAQDMVPPAKRVRTDWGDDRRGMGGYSQEGASYENNYSSGWQHYSSHSSTYAHTNTSRSSITDSLETQPAMLSFKIFLQSQDDNITDEEALKKYNEYKLEFKRQQLNEFFVTHKEEEWFKIKYHPEEAVKRQEELMAALQNRVEVFQDFLDGRRFDKVSVDSEKSEDLIKLLDIAVIKLEGGSVLDVQALEQRIPVTYKEGTTSKQDTSEKSMEETVEKIVPKMMEEEVQKPLVLEGNEEESKVEDKAEEMPAANAEAVLTEPLALQINIDQELLQKKAEEYSKQKPAKGKGKGEGEYSNSSDSEPPTPSGDLNGSTDEPPPPGLDEDRDLKKVEDNEDGEKAEGELEEGQEDEEKEFKDFKSDNGAEDISDKEEESDKMKDKDDQEEGEEGMDIEELNNEKSGRSTPEALKPRCLHRTSSIFLRNLSPTITKQEVEAMCKRYPGFLRVALADPQPERRWFRRGWVTFQRHVNIKDICWNLNNVRLRDCELGAIVNRDLTRRIRTVNGITSHKEVIRNDIKLAARMVHNLDSRAGLWGGTNEQNDTKDLNKPEGWPLNFWLESKNPILKNITDYLIEEASAEEEELLGIKADSEEGQLVEERSRIVRDDNLIRVLDRLLMYLRIVHSVDYYNHCEYPNEDEMPNRMGIMHARGIPPPTKQLSTQDVGDYCSMFEQKIASFLQPIPKLSDEDYSHLGNKDPDAEVEKFVQANTQELAKDKWLCPLSGKKFKGSDFVRKHIFNKHAEKVDEVKKEVEFFNNYLRDPKRPELPDHPGNRSGSRKEVSSERESYNSPMQPYVQPQRYSGSYGSGYGGHRHGGYGSGHSYSGPYSQGYNQGYSGRSNRGGYRGRGGSAEFRPVIHYRDLDAPREPEEFI